MSISHPLLPNPISPRLSPISRPKILHITTKPHISPEDTTQHHQVPYLAPKYYTSPPKPYVSPENTTQPSPVSRPKLLHITTKPHISPQKTTHHYQAPYLTPTYHRTLLSCPTSLPRPLSRPMTLPQQWYCLSATSSHERRWRVTEGRWVFLCPTQELFYGHITHVCLLLQAVTTL